MSAVRQLSAVDSVRGAEDLRKKQAARDEWPYVHLFPPPNSIPVHQIGYVAVPMAPATAVIATYQVPSGFKFIMHAILNAYDAAFLPGDSLWTMTVNPLGGGQANPVQGLIQVPVPLGSWKYGSQWPFVRPYEFAPLDFLQLAAANVNLTTGDFYVSGFFGYLIPTTSTR